MESWSDLLWRHKNLSEFQELGTGSDGYIVSLNNAVSVTIYKNARLMMGFPIWRKTWLGNDYETTIFDYDTTIWNNNIQLFSGILNIDYVILSIYIFKYVTNQLNTFVYVFQFIFCHFLYIFSYAAVHL